MNRDDSPQDPVSLPRVRVPFGQTSIVVRIPNPGRLPVINRPLRDLAARLAESTGGRAEQEQHGEWLNYAAGWLVLRMVDDPAWTIDTLGELEAQSLDRESYPELQYGALFLDELAAAAGYQLAEVWRFLNAAQGLTGGIGLTEVQAREVDQTARSFPAAGGGD